MFLKTVILVHNAKLKGDHQKPINTNLRTSSPMEFIALDIGFMPQDIEGFQYILLIGDMFSKYIEVVPLRNQTTPTISKALLENWLNLHNYPQLLLTDQGSNVDGKVINNLCKSFNIKKFELSDITVRGTGSPNEILDP